MFEAQVELGSGGARLVMADGTRLPAPKTGIETGAPVLAVVRPERIQIRQAGTDGAAGPQAVIEDMVYLGQALRRSEEHTSELQSLMRISYAVFCLKKKKKHTQR